MPPLTSAGLLLYHPAPDGVRVLLVHPGGPFFRNKDDGFWSIPKGEPAPGEDLARAACREFAEEVGYTIDVAPDRMLSLGEVKLKSGKHVHAWAVAGALPDGFVLSSNLFTMEWPPRSGRHQSFAEVDRAEMFDLATARRKINAAQATFLDRLIARLTEPTPQGGP